MAVLKSYRHAGVGKKLLQRAIAAAEELGGGYIYLHAQVAVMGFYEIFGFRVTGHVFNEAGIPHRKMVLRAKKAR
jgi:predicted GNAT family N-acyltransferase